MKCNVMGHGNKVLVDEKLIEEVCGALMALSMSNNGIEYLDKLCNELEKSIEKKMKNDDIAV